MTRRLLALIPALLLAACNVPPPNTAYTGPTPTISASPGPPPEAYPATPAGLAAPTVYPQQGEGWAHLVARTCTAGTDWRTQVNGQRLWYGYAVQLTCAAPTPKPSPAASANPTPATAWVNPLTTCHRITSSFGWRNGKIHQGVDLSTPVGTPVKAAAAGKVYWVNDTGPDGKHGGGGGWMIYMAHAGNVWTSYHHLSKRFHKGDWVAAGTIIGYSGGARGAAGAGNSTGPHVHIQVMPWGRGVKHYNATLKAYAYTNPVTWFAARGVKLGCS